MKLLEKLLHALNAMQVYQWSEVLAFCQIFYLPEYKQNPSDHARMENHIESLMMQRMSENDSIVTRYINDTDFQKGTFPILAKEIYQGVLEKQE